MELRLTAEHEAKLNALALRTRRDTNERLSEAVDFLVEYNEWFDRKITACLEDVEANGAVPDEDMAAWLESRKRHWEQTDAATTKIFLVSALISVHRRPHLAR